MKIVELLNAVQIPITNEEASILEMFNESEVVLKADLDPREQLMANSLVNKDILRRNNVDGKVTYRKKIR
jgi:hypothetical protein